MKLLRWGRPITVSSLFRWLPPSEDAAWEYLERILDFNRNRNRNRNRMSEHRQKPLSKHQQKACQKRILQVIQRYPRLVSRWDKDKKNRRSPILHLVLTTFGHRPSLRLVKTLCEMNPSAIVVPSYERNSTALSLLFFHMPQEDFLSAASSSSRSLLPSSPPSTLELKLSILRIFLEYYPTAVTSVRDWLGHNLLELALVYQCPPALFDFLLKHYNHNNPMSLSFLDEVETLGIHPGLRYREWQDYFIPIDKTQAEIICHVLPRVRNLVCVPQEWDLDAFTMILERLGQKKNPVELRQLRLSLPHECFASNNVSSSICCNSLHTVLARSAHCLTVLELKRICINDENKNNDDTALLQILLRWLLSNRTLQKLTLRNFSFPSWNILDVEGFPKSNLLEPGDVPSKVLTSNLETLQLRECRMSPNDFIPKGLLSALRNVKELYIYHPTLREQEHNNKDFTANIVAVLQHPKNYEQQRRMGLQKLYTSGLRVDLQQLCSCLQHNAVLKTIEGSISENGRSRNTWKKECQAAFKSLLTVNSTLENVCMGFSASDDMEYFLLLNRWGRRMVQQVGTSKSSFVQLLCNVHEAEYHQIYFEYKKRSLCYGLLRENPAIWAH